MPRKKLADPGPVTTRIRVGDHMVLTTIAVHPARIEYARILAAAEVVEDPDMGAPWKEHDGWEHEAIDEQALGQPPWMVDGEPRYNTNDVVRTSRGFKLIVITRDMAREKWGLYGRLPGEAAQPAWERSERIRRQAIEQLKRWYSRGYTWYGVTCKYEGYRASVWGIQTENDSASDSYLDEVRRDMADEVAAAMEKDGYTIVGRPKSQAAWSAAPWIAQHLGFASGADYRAWLTRVPRLP